MPVHIYSQRQSRTLDSEILIFSGLSILQYLRNFFLPVTVRRSKSHEIPWNSNYSSLNALTGSLNASNESPYSCSLIEIVTFYDYFAIAVLGLTEQRMILKAD